MVCCNFVPANFEAMWSDHVGPLGCSLNRLAENAPCPSGKHNENQRTEFILSIYRGIDDDTHHSGWKRAYHAWRQERKQYEKKRPSFRIGGCLSDNNGPLLLVSTEVACTEHAVELARPDRGLTERAWRRSGRIHRLE